MLFIKLVKVLDSIEKISSTDKMRNILSDLFKHSKKNEWKNIVYLLLKCKSFNAPITGISEKTILTILSELCPKSNPEIIYSKEGDLGNVAFKITKNKKTKLTLNQIISLVKNLSLTQGKNSKDIKINLIKSVLNKSTPLEAKYLVRILQGKLRIGVGDKIIIDAISIALTNTKKSKNIIKNLYDVSPDLPKIVDLIAKNKLTNNNLTNNKKSNIKLGTPIKMMLAQRLKDFNEIKTKFNDNITSEWKYDGERVQIHKTNNHSKILSFLSIKKNNVHLFSRRLTDISSQFPEIIEHINELEGNNFIIEGEIVAFDNKNNKIMPFQTLMQRRRKYDIEEYKNKIPIKVFLFDVLYYNNTDLINHPYSERRKILEKIAVKTNAVSLFNLAEQIQTSNINKIKDFFKNTIKKGSEGLIIKSNNSIYSSGIRAWSWGKIKKDYISGLSDSFDLVVLGYFNGKGKRKNAFGALLCGVYNENTNQYETLTKVGTGFKDEDLKNIFSQLKQISLSSKPHNVNSKLSPNSWVKPQIIIEVSGAEITKSPIHTCNLNNKTGLALRFPRFIRVRNDKSIKEVTTTKEIIDIISK